MTRSWKKHVLIGVLSCACLATAFGQKQPRHNTPARPLTLELVQAPHDAKATLESLKGQAVVLEFWATWCGGCIAEIPHLNSIAESFKDKPIRFISITDEKPATVNFFLKKRPISGWVAADENGATFRNYGIIGRPQTVLIDAAGTYRGTIPAPDLTTETVNALLAGTLQLPEREDTPLIGTEPNAPAPLVHVLIRPAMSVEQVNMAPGAMRQTNDTFEVWGMDLRRLLSFCFDVPGTRVVLPKQYEGQGYDISITLPNAKDDIRKQIIQTALETTFQSKAHREIRETDVYVLRKASGARPELIKSEQGKPVAWLAQFAEERLGRPVLNESGLQGKYQFSWSHATTKLDDINTQLHDALGLELVAARRPVEVLVFEPVDNKPAQPSTAEKR